MASIPNPPVFDESSPPADQQCLVWNAATGQWVAHAITSAAVTVPQTHIAAASAPAAQTGAAVVTANAAAPSGSYVQADEATIATLANALKTDYNKTITDIANLITEVAAQRTIINSLLTELQTAGVLSAS